MLSWASAAFRSLNNLITLSSRVFSFLGNKITGETLIVFFAWNQPNSTRLALWVTYFNPHRSPRQIKNILKQIKILPRCSLHTVLPGSLIAVGGWQQSVNSRWSRPDRNRNIWFTGGVKIPGLNGTREWRGEKVGTPPLRRPQRSHNKRETKTSWMFFKCSDWMSRVSFSASHSGGVKDGLRTFRAGVPVVRDESLTDNFHLQTLQHRLWRWVGWTEHELSS